MKLNVKPFSMRSNAAGTTSGSTSPALRGLRKQQAKVKAEDFTRYQTDLVGYSREVLKVEFWAGVEGHPGQLELAEAIGESIRMQLAGEPGAKKYFRVPSGHGTGKTFFGGDTVNWFFDSFPGGICYTTAPTAKQVKLLLWKDIRRLRPAHLPGQPLPVEPLMRRGDDWFAIGLTTDNANGRGTEAFQGQHPPYLLIVLDEAEGVPDFVFDATNAMMTGGVVIVLMLANPRTRTSRFHKIGSKSNCLTIRFDCLNHPNVVAGQDVIPGAVTRAWVDEMIDDHCETVAAHNEDEYTFEVPWRPGVIFKPDAEFLFRVRGIAPKNLADRTIIPVGRYEAARDRTEGNGRDDVAFLGVDCARFGSDYGTLYVNHAGRIWRAYRFAQDNTLAYTGEIRAVCLDLLKKGVRRIDIRFDGGGGFAGGPVDTLRADMDLKRHFADGFNVFEVAFGGTPTDPKAFADKITELYAATSDVLPALQILNPPNELESDLTDRKYGWATKDGLAVKKLVDKEQFRKDFDRSPDDGDGFVLAAAPAHLFGDAADNWGGYR